MKQRANERPSRTRSICYFTVCTLLFDPIRRCFRGQIVHFSSCSISAIPTCCSETRRRVLLCSTTWSIWQILSTTQPMKTSIHGKTPLHMACFTGVVTNLDFVKLLLEAEASETYATLSRGSLERLRLSSLEGLLVETRDHWATNYIHAIHHYYLFISLVRNLLCLYIHISIGTQYNRKLNLNAIVFISTQRSLPIVLQ
jgi:hypothetical protein